jgi:hypothetical protein
MQSVYEQIALSELTLWRHQMVQSPTFMGKVAQKVQHKMNTVIPEKIHQAITATIKQMIRATLFGAEKTTGLPLPTASLEQTEAVVRNRIEFYKRAAAAEGGITGAGGFLLGLADFPLLVGLKIKMLFDIAALYGYAVDDYRERVYLLYIFQLAFSSQAQRRQVYLQMNNWEMQKQTLPADLHQFDWRTFQQEYRDYIDIPKMAQMVPIIGAPIGAVVNYKLLNKLGIYAMNAYRMRWQELGQKKLR